MWNFLDPGFRYYISPHKKSTLSWKEGKEVDTDLLEVNYQGANKLNSAGFRAEVLLEPNTTYQLEIEAKLILGDLAFVYVESGNNRLVPRFKIYKNEYPYNLKHNFVTPAVGEFPNVSVFVGILFYNGNTDYLLEVSKFKLQKIAKLTEQNLKGLTSEMPLSETPSILTTYYNPVAPHSGGGILTRDEIAQIVHHELESTLGAAATNYTFPTNHQITNSELGSDRKQLLKQDVNVQQQRLNVQQQQKQFQSQMKDMGGDWDTSTYFTRNTVNQMRKTLQDKSDLVNLLIDPNEPTEEELLKGEAYQWLPISVTKSLIEAFKNKMKNEGIKVEVSLTTTPFRIGKVRRVVDSILKQSIPINKIYVVVPTRYKKKNVPYLVSKKWYFKTDSRVNIVRVPDIGPMNKLHSVLPEVNKKHILLTIDDDHLYPRHWALFLSFLPVMYPEFRGVYGFKGSLDNKNIQSQNLVRPKNVNWLSSELGVAYPRKWISNEAQMLKQVSYSQNAFYSDNLLISNHLANSNIARIVIPRVEADLADLVYPKKTKWADDKESLHRMNPPINIRYPLVINTLRDKKHHYLDNLGGVLTKSNKEEIEIMIEQQKMKAREAERDPTMVTADPVIEEKKTTVKEIQTSPSTPAVSQGLASPNKLIKTSYPKFDPRYFDDKKVRYISYQSQVYHPEWTLLYLKKLPNASLEMPNLSYNVSLPQAYAPYFQGDPNKYDVIVVDLPFCKEDVIRLKTDKPVFYLYRNPELGNRLAVEKGLIEQIKKEESKDVSDKEALKKKTHRKMEITKVLINSNFASGMNSKMTRSWRVLPDLEIKNIGAQWNREQKHLVHIVSDPYYITNLELMIDFWKNHCEGLPVKLHLGVVPPLAQMIQTLINEAGIKNINLYTQSNIFGNLIYKADYYFSLGYHLDLYAVWAHQNAKKLIMMAYGEFKNYPNLVPVPYIPLSRQKICPEMFVDHSTCTGEVCQVYGKNEVFEVPQVNQGALKNLFQMLFLENK